MFVETIGSGGGHLYNALSAGPKNDLQTRPAERSQRTLVLVSSGYEAYSKIWTSKVHSSFCHGGMTLEVGQSGSLLAGRDASCFLALPSLPWGADFFFEGVAGALEEFDRLGCPREFVTAVVRLLCEEVPPTWRRSLVEAAV